MKYLLLSLTLAWTAFGEPELIHDPDRGLNGSAISIEDVRSFPEGTKVKDLHETLGYPLLHGSRSFPGAAFLDKEDENYVYIFMWTDIENFRFDPEAEIKKVVRTDLNLETGKYEKVWPLEKDEK